MADKTTKYKKLMARFEDRVRRSGLLATDELAEVHSRSGQLAGGFVESLCVLGLFRDDINKIFFGEFRCRFTDVRDYQIEDELLDLFSEAILFDRKCLPFASRDDGYCVAFVDPTETETRKVLEFITDRKIHVFATCERFVEDRLADYFSVYSRTYDACPNCNSTEFVRIVYGLPSAEAIEAAGKGRFILGGCSVWRGSPLWYCKKCQHRW